MMRSAGVSSRFSSFKAIFYRAWESTWYQAALFAVWAGLVLFLPITSFPLLRRLSGASTVAPPSTALLLGFTLLWLLPFILLRGKIPVEGVPLLFFVGAALVSTALAFFWAAPPYRDRTPIDEAPVAYLTLAMGLAAFFIPSAWLSCKQKYFRVTLQLINLSGMVLIGWSLFQAFFIFFDHGNYPSVMLHLQHLISSRRDALFSDRVAGMAYEPSWLAHQLNMLYLPIWLSASLLRFSAHRWRLWQVSLENLLLAAGLVVLFVSFSRVGVLTFLLVAAYLAFTGVLRLARRISSRLLVRSPKHSILPLAAFTLRAGVSAVLLLSFFVLLSGSAFGLFTLGARFEPRLKRIAEQNPFAAGGFYEVTNQLAIAERVVYWATGIEIFNDHPLIGVGLGNVGFYFFDKMPAFGWALTEIAMLFNYHSFLPNTKSLWVRILAETGILGFALFLAWYYLLWRSVQVARASQEPLFKVIGLAGQMVLIGFLLEGFSIDSFALPYFWFSAGLLAASAMSARSLALSARSAESL